MPRKKKEAETVNLMSVKEFGDLVNRGEKLDTMVKRWIPIQDMMTIVGNVVQGCFIDGAYMPQYIPILRYAAILRYYCNVAYGDLDELLEFVYWDARLMDCVCELISAEQLRDIDVGIARCIDNRKEELLRLIASPSDMTLDNLNSVLVGVSNFIDKLQDKIELVDSFQMDKLLALMSKLKKPNET